MKFGKELLQAANQSNPEWGPFWLNYKALKKSIKSVVRSSNTHSPLSSNSSTQFSSSPSETNEYVKQKALTESQAEIEFFTELRSQLRKLSCFYIAEEKRCIFRFQQLKMVLDEMKSKQQQQFVDEMDAKRLMLAFVHFYRECIQLENFAVMNYQGFSKILKKHDKMTGHNTRTKYMRKMVNQSPFANYPQLIAILQTTEKLFAEIPVPQSAVKETYSNHSCSNSFEEDASVQSEMDVSE